MVFHPTQKANAIPEGSLCISRAVYALGAEVSMPTATAAASSAPSPRGRLIALHEIIFAVDAEQKSLEEVATPLAAAEPTRAPG